MHGFNELVVKGEHGEGKKITATNIDRTDPLCFAGRLQIVTGFALFPCLIETTCVSREGFVEDCFMPFSLWRTRSGSSLSLDGKVRGQRMTTDRSCSPSDLTAVSAVSFILPRHLLWACPELLFWVTAVQTFYRRIMLTDRVRQPGPVDHNNSASRDGGHIQKKTRG